MAGFGFPVASEKFDDNSFHEYRKVQSIPSQFVDLITLTVPSNESRLLTYFNVSSRILGVVEFIVGSEVFFVGRNSPAHPDILVRFDPPKQLNASDVLTVRFCANDRPISSDINLYLSGFTQTQ